MLDYTRVDEKAYAYIVIDARLFPCERIAR